MKIKFIIIVAVLSLLCSGCSNNYSINKSNELMNDMNEFYVYSDNQYQPCWGKNSFIKRVENGYYYIYNELLYYYDIESEMVTPLCSSIDCDHNDESCNAYLGAYGDNFQYGFNTLGFEIYNNNIYILGYEINEVCDFYVYCISKDGSERKKLFYLYSLEFDNENLYWNYDLIMHEGFYYGIIDYENNMSLSKIDLNGNIQTIIDLNDKYEVSVDKICAYGENIYFEASWFEDEELTQFYDNLYKYDINSDSIEIVLENAGLNGNNFYLLDESKILYMDLEFNILICDISTGENISEIYSEGIYSEFSYDGIYVYVVNSETNELIVFDTDGNVIDQMSSNGTWIFGDSTYLFVESGNQPDSEQSSDEWGVWALDKYQLGSEKKEWIKLSNNE